MRVLHALESFLPVSENWIHPQITKVPGVTPAILCHDLINTGLFPVNGAPFFRDPPPWNEKLGLPRLVNSLAFRIGVPMLVARRSARRWEPDLIHAHFGMCGWQMISLHRDLSVPLVASFYGVDAWMLPRQGTLWRTRLNELFGAAARLLAEGPAMRQRLIEIGCPAEKVEVVRLGVDVDALPFRPRDFQGRLRVAMMARFVEKKGLVDGMNAFTKAVQAGADFCLFIIGDATDEAGEQIKREMHAIANSSPLSGRVCFEGFLNPSEARNLLERADVFLCPSRHARSGDAEGGSPLALTEAMAMGLLCIGTRHCDLPELIIANETGLLCEEGDVTALAQALLRAASSPLEATRLCQAGRTLVEQRFGREQQMNSLAEVYRSVLHREQSA